MELVKASQLGLPHISGTVNVPLAELDRMRADHALAVKLAKELEERQAEVKVIYAQYEKTYGGCDFHGNVQYRNELVEKKVEYKGFDEFRSRIADEEKAKVQKEITCLKDSVASIEAFSSKQGEELIKMTAEKKELVKALEERISDLKIITEERDQLKTSLESSNTEAEHLRFVLSELNKELHISRNEKSFWYWLINKF